MPPRFVASVLRCLPGIGLCAALATFALVVSGFTHVPPVLLALILGIGCSRLGSTLILDEGVRFSARNLLRFGIALLGVRLSAVQIAALGWQTVLLAVGGVAVTLTVGSFIGRLFGLSANRATLSAGSVGICGASAALAFSAVLPETPDRERQTVLTVALVTLLSTIAMLLYPLLARFMGMNSTQAGVFFGASIHDVTQVVGAGAMISPEAAATATATKLVRIACLAPAAALVGAFFLSSPTAESRVKRPPVFPLFLASFVLMAAITNVGFLPRGAVLMLSAGATACLVMATAALGLRTSVRELAGAGWRPVATMAAQTILIAVYALVGLHLLRL